jgi:hypothetical protein
MALVAGSVDLLLKQSVLSLGIVVAEAALLLAIDNRGVGAERMIFLEAHAVHGVFVQ